MINNAATFDSVARLVCARLGWPYDTTSATRLTTGQWHLLRAEISAAQKWAWEHYWFEDVMHTCRVQLRADWSSTTAYTAEDTVFYADANAYFIAVQASTNEPPAAQDGDEWDTNYEFWARVDEPESVEQGEWQDSVDYTQGQRVSWHGDIYQCHTDVVGNALPSDTDYWGLVPDFEPYVTYAGLDASGVTRPVIGRMQSVTDVDPRSNQAAHEYEFDPTPLGIRLYNLGNCTRPWIHYRVRCPQLTGDPWAAGSYTPELSAKAVWGYESTLDVTGSTVTSTREIYAGSGLPNVTPNTATALWVNTDDGNIFPYYDGSWHT